MLVVLLETGKINGFYKLKETINTNSIVTGCAAQILNNSIKTTADTQAY